MCNDMPGVLEFNKFVSISRQQTTDNITQIPCLATDLH